MTRLIGQRLVEMLGILVLVGTVLFFILRLSGDPLSLLLPEDAGPEARARLSQSLGLDQPQHVQYLRYMLGMARLDFGTSFRYREPAMHLVVERVPATLQLTLSATLLSLVLAIPLGVVAALRPSSVWGSIAKAVALIGQSIPNFWLGIMLILLFSVTLQLLPSFGAGTLAHLVLPALTLSSLLVAKITRLVRSGVLETIREDYVRTARAKGLRPARVISHHVLRTVLIPIVTLLGLEVSFLMGGAVVTETVFAWPGIGRQLITAVLARDYPVVQATVFLVAVIVVVTNLVVDLLYVALDPRVRLDR